MPGVDEDEELVVLIVGCVLVVVDVEDGVLAVITVVGAAAVGVYVLAVVAAGCVVVVISMEEDGVLVMLIVDCVLVEFDGMVVVVGAKVVVVGAKVVVDGRLYVTPVVDTLPCIKVFGHLTSFVTAKPAAYMTATIDRKITTASRTAINFFLVC